MAQDETRMVARNKLYVSLHAKIRNYHTEPPKGRKIKTFQINVSERRRGARYMVWKPTVSQQNSLGL